MTIKEAARDLGVSEDYILGLIRDSLIDYYVIGEAKLPKVREEFENGRVKFSHPNTYMKRIGIDPEELDYIDWYLNIGGDDRVKIRNLARGNKDLQRLNGQKMKAIIIIY